MSNETFTVALRGSHYALSLSVDLRASSSPHLALALRRQDAADAVWAARFSDKYIEEITKKTGNFKRFPVFVEMLLSAVKQQSKVVSLDVLLSEDLDAMRRGEQLGFSSDGPTATTKKIYLILTYSVAFDRLSEEYRAHDISATAATVSALKEQIARLQHEKIQNLDEISRLLKENDKLKHQLKHDLRGRTTSPTRARTKADRGSEGQTRAIQEKIFELVTELKDIAAEHKTATLSKTLEALKKLLVQINTPVESHVPNLERRYKSHISPSSESRAESSTRRQKYSVVKSRPLVRSPPRSMSKNSRGSSRAMSPSFRRFDPTLYVLEREQRLLDRRKSSAPASRNSSVDSCYRSQGSVNSRDSRRSDTNSRVNSKPLINTGGVYRPGVAKSGQKRNSTNRGEVDHRWKENLQYEDNEDIDKRLASLQRFLNSQT